MGDSNAPPLQPQQLLELLARHNVDYIIVGGIGAAVHGSTRATTDIDVVPDTDTTNMSRLADALAEANAELRIEDGTTVRFPLDAESLATLELSTWRTDHGDIDIIRGIPDSSMTDLADYERLATNAISANAWTLKIKVASLRDIIKSKEIANRPTDQAALPELYELRSKLTPRTEHD